MFVGDQGDPVFLNRVLDEIGPLDVIIDDGSHRVEHQRASLLVLFPGLRPGGLYVLEDLFTAFFAPFGGEPTGLAETSSVRVVHELTFAMLGRGAPGDLIAHGLYGRVESVDCFFDACVFIKGPMAGSGLWKGPTQMAWMRAVQPWERTREFWK